MGLLRIAALLVLLLQNAPARPAGTASLEGIVVRVGTNEPIAGADLELTAQNFQVTAGTPPTPMAPFAAVSGPDGKFVFRNVTSGNYKLVAARVGGGFTPYEYGQRGYLGRGVTFPIADGE